MKRLETKRLIIQKISSDDAVMAHELFSDDDAMRWVGIYPPLTSMEETIQRLNEWHEDEEEQRFSLISKETNEFLGYIAINPDSEEEREDTKELGFALRAKARKKGYMTEALKAVLKELKEENIIYVWACFFEGNKESEKLIKSLGFEFMDEDTYEVANDKEYVSFAYRLTL